MLSTRRVLALLFALVVALLGSASAHIVGAARPAFAPANASEPFFLFASADGVFHGTTPRPVRLGRRRAPAENDVQC